MLLFPKFIFKMISYDISTERKRHIAHDVEGCVRRCVILDRNNLYTDVLCIMDFRCSHTHTNILDKL